MKTTKQMTMALAVMVFLFATGCGSSPSSSSGSSSALDELDLAIRDASDYLNDNIPKGSKIVILNIQSSSSDLSDYIIDELIANTVNDRNFLVVDRQQLDIIRAERDFQWSGEVNDNDAVEIGKTAGAQTIVSGAVNRLGTGYRIRIRALEVQTAQVQGQYNRNIDSSRMIAAIMESDNSGGTGTRTAASPSGTGGQTTQTATPAQPAASVYKIGDTGPAGGLIFYDKGNNSGGWRYLEAAPANTDREPINIASDSNDTAIARSKEFALIRDRRLGAGKENTVMLMGIFEKFGGGINSPAWICSNLEVNGFNDWYLPSLDELIMLYTNTYGKDGSGGFRSAKYRSSTYNPDGGVATIDFANIAKEGPYDINEKTRVRAVRRF
jgi:TolB-like protein